MTETGGDVRVAAELIYAHPWPEVAGLLARDAGMANGFPDRTHLATGLGGRRGDRRSAETEGVREPALRVGRQEHGISGVRYGLGARGGCQRKQGEQKGEGALHVSIPGASVNASSVLCEGHGYGVMLI
jgi:hypothetical protein